GLKLYQRNARHAPTIAPAMTTIWSLAWMYGRNRNVAYATVPAISASSTNANDTIAIGPAASPSRPSVRLTALLDPVITTVPITTNAASGRWICTALKNGT